MTAKYSDWFKTHTFDQCGVGRGEYGKFLMSYIGEEKEGFVLNLNGGWGTGKTEFLKKMYSGLNEIDHPVIYIDAWESDFTDNPLIVVASELLSQLKSFFEIDGSDLDILSRCIGRFLRAGAITTGGAVGKAFLGDAALGTEFVKALMETQPEEYLQAVTANYSEQVSAIKNVREELERLASDLAESHDKKLPVIVLVDELDRCRPNYAVEMLEVIKHFFATKNFVFVVATDTSELMKSIKVLYGSEFDSKTYLKRFFNREAQLSAPALEMYIDSFETPVMDNITLYPEAYQFESNIVSKYLLFIAEAYNLSLRDIEQLQAQLRACLSTISKSGDCEQFVNLFCLLVALVECDKNLDNFKLRGNDDPRSDWSGKNLVLNDTSKDGPVTFKAMYDLNMKFSVFYRGQKTVLQHGQEVYTNVSPSYVSRFKLNSGAPELLKDIDKSLRQNLQKNNKQEGDVLMWEDYKRLALYATTLS